jgi:hypothetical protein
MTIKHTILGQCKVCGQQATIYNDVGLNTYGKCKECARKEWDERVKAMATTSGITQSTSVNVPIGLHAYWSMVALEQKYVCHVP